MSREMHAPAPESPTSEPADKRQATAGRPLDGSDGAPRRRHREPDTATVARVVATAVGVLLLFYAAYLARSVLVLVVVSAFLAVGLDPAVRRLEDWHLSRGQAVTIMFLVLVLVFVGFFFAVVPQLVRQATNFVSDLPGYVEDLAERNPRIQEFVAENDIPQRLRDAAAQVPTYIGSSLGSVVNIAGSIIGTFFAVITVIVLTIYFMLSLSRIRSESLRLIPKSRRRRVQELADPMLAKIGGFIAGQVTIAVIAGVLAFIFFLIMRLPSPIALALWVSIAALIPLVGATIGAIPAVIVAFFTSTGVGIATVVYFVVYQQLENYVLAPRVMNRTVDVSPAAVLLAALIGGTLLGFVGALMAIPTAACIKLIAQEVLLPRAESS